MPAIERFDEQNGDILEPVSTELLTLQKLGFRIHFRLYMA